MIVQRNFLNKLKDFGLNTYESKLWTALLSRGISTAGELSDISNVPRSRTYDVLESLEKKGFIIVKIGKPIKYIAVPPDEVLKRVKKKIQEEAQYRNDILEQLASSKILDELTLLHNHGVEMIEPGDLSGSFKGKENIYTHLDSMIKSAKKSVLIMTTSSDLLKNQDILCSSLKRASDKGISIKIAAPLTKEQVKNIKKILEIADVRITSIDTRFVVVDDSELFFMLLDDKKVHSSYDVGIWVNTKLFSSSMSYFFNKEWESLSPLS